MGASARCLRRQRYGGGDRVRVPCARRLSSVRWRAAGPPPGRSWPHRPSLPASSPRGASGSRMPFACGRRAGSSCGRSPYERLSSRFFSSSGLRPGSPRAWLKGWICGRTTSTGLRRLPCVWRPRSCALPSRILSRLTLTVSDKFRRLYCLSAKDNCLLWDVGRAGRTTCTSAAPTPHSAPLRQSRPFHVLRAF
jgi:hypothetical protein